MVDSIKVILNIVFLVPLLIILSCGEDSSIQPEPIAEAPKVNIVSPTDSSFIGDFANIIVSATDNKGIIKVEIYIDSQTTNDRTLEVEPFEYLWDASNEPTNSIHTIYAKAYDDDNNVSSSKIVSVTKVLIEPPTNFSVELKADTAVNFSWDINDPFGFTFVLEQSINNNEYQEILKAPTGALTISFEQPFYIDTTYLFRVRSKKNGILSKPSNMDSIVVVFPKPTNLEVEKIGSTNLGLSWLDNSNLETHYLVEKSEESGAFIQVASLPANSFYYFDDSFNENIINIYTVRAISTHNKSDSALIIISRPPVLSSSVIEPDTAVVTTTVEILTSVEATDPDGNGDIEEVYYFVYRPDGTTSQKILLFDNGNPANGDEIAGDGIYSRLIQVNQYNDKGTYRFEFQAENIAGSLSNIINHFVLIL